MYVHKFVTLISGPQNLAWTIWIPKRKKKGKKIVLIWRLDAWCVWLGWKNDLWPKSLITHWAKVGTIIPWCFDTCLLNNLTKFEIFIPKNNTFQYSIFSFTNFCKFKKAIFENFNIFNNNKTSVEGAKVVSRIFVRTPHSLKANT